jgi:hypothetical protein
MSNHLYRLAHFGVPAALAILQVAGVANITLGVASSGTATM